VAARVTIGELRQGAIGEALCKLIRFSFDDFIREPARITSNFFFSLGIGREVYHSHRGGLFHKFRSTITQA
jgi:hypothetical protein